MELRTKILSEFNIKIKLSVIILCGFKETLKSKPIYLHSFPLYVPVITLSCIIAKPSDIFRYNHDE